MEAMRQDQPIPPVAIPIALAGLEETQLRSTLGAWIDISPNGLVANLDRPHTLAPKRIETTFLDAAAQGLFYLACALGQQPVVLRHSARYHAAALGGVC